MAIDREELRQRLLRHAVFLACLAVSIWLLLRVRTKTAVLSPNADTVITESGLNELLNSRARTKPNSTDAVTKNPALAGEIPPAQIMVKVDRRAFTEHLSFAALESTTDGGFSVSSNFIDLFSIPNPDALRLELQILADNLLQEQRRRKVVEPIEPIGAGLNKIYIPDVETELRTALPRIAIKFTSPTNVGIFSELVFNDFYWRKFVTRHTFSPISDPNGEIFIGYSSDTPSIRETGSARWSRTDFAKLSSMAGFATTYPYHITLRELSP